MTSVPNGTNSDIGKFLTSKELANLLRVPMSTLRKWQMRGYGPHGFIVGRQRVYRESVVSAWITDQEKAAKSA
jgi:prophage regulatory protein